MLVQRYHDLLGSIPALHDNRRLSQQWDPDQESSTILHKCVGRRVMNVFYADDTPSSPAHFSCWSACSVRLEGREIVPIIDSTADLEGSSGLGSHPGALSSSSPSISESLNAVRALPVTHTHARPLEFVPDPSNLGSASVAGNGAIFSVSNDVNSEM
jgi:hypothetical protein